MHILVSELKVKEMEGSWSNQIYTNTKLQHSVTRTKNNTHLTRTR